MILTNCSLQDLLACLSPSEVNMAILLLMKMEDICVLMMMASMTEFGLKDLLPPGWLSCDDNDSQDGNAADDDGDDDDDDVGG